MQCCRCESELVFFFNDTATTEIYTLSLHDALPIWIATATCAVLDDVLREGARAMLQQAIEREVAEYVEAHKGCLDGRGHRDRKSTRLNSSHANISYAVFCLKKKKIIATHTHSSA